MRLAITTAMAISALVLAGCAERNVASRTISGTADRSVPATPGLLPAGTNLQVRTNQTISADRAVEGQTYSGEIAADVVDATGRVAIPKGSPATLVVADVSGGSAVTTPELELGLQSVTVGGTRYMVTTPTVEQESDRAGLGANPRTAKMVGGGALLGTLIGAIAGGGSGAAAGAAIGAAGGAVAQVLTKGSRVNVPAETVLSFRLDQPIQLEGFRY